MRSRSDPQQRPPESGEAASAAQEAPWHAIAPAAVANLLGASLEGLETEAAVHRLERFGPNRLEPPRPIAAWRVLLRQFQSPLIYVLLAASTIALALGERSDAAFIGAVLVLNAAIGFANELRADRQVHALFQQTRGRARLRRDGTTRDVDATEVVPGDVLLLESGERIAADVRLLDSKGLRVDESMLTGESLAVEKRAEDLLEPGTPMADRRNMAFSSTLVSSGRGVGLVVATGARTQIGAIARDVAAVDTEKPPLVVRMERFARLVGAMTLGTCGVLVLIGLLQGEPWGEVLLGAVALAVSAIPEGLPVALTVALAVAVSRMARRNVIARHLTAVEALGSCGVIATDKTGTLTQNELTVECAIAGGVRYDATGRGYVPHGEVVRDGRSVVVAEHPGLFRLVRAAALANEASLVECSDGPESWDWSGDPTDVALLAFSIKAGCSPWNLAQSHPLQAAIPFEPEHRYAASFLARDGGGLVCVKGAPERVLAMCGWAFDAARGERLPLDADAALADTEELTRAGYRVLAIAEAETSAPAPRDAAPAEPSGLTFLGVVGMTDPPREGVEASIAACHRAGIHVVMVTGDHAVTAAAIGARIGLAPADAPVLTGERVAGLDEATLADVVPRYAVVARATPRDKLRVVGAWQRRGDFVAVTGDGVNDAPALRQANIGAAMGRSGTDVARESAELVIRDDDFSSIVAGVEEGRIAYDNVRKVTYLLISTGAGEVLLVASALALGLSVPFTAVQLLWLNLVTNGIQDVALAFEAGEPGVLDRPPRPSGERIFDRVMIERTLIAAAAMGCVGLAAWFAWRHAGRSVAEGRNLVVNLFVAFEILHIGNSRSETISLFRLSPLRNPVLLLGTLGALAVHAAALYAPPLQGLLGVAPLGLQEWLTVAALASSIVIVMELHKAARKRWPWPVPSSDRRSEISAP